MFLYNNCHAAVLAGRKGGSLPPADKYTMPNLSGGSETALPKSPKLTALEEGLKINR